LKKVFIQLVSLASRDMLMACIVGVNVLFPFN